MAAGYRAGDRGREGGRRDEMLFVRSCLLIFFKSLISQFVLLLLNLIIGPALDFVDRLRFIFVFYFIHLCIYIFIIFFGFSFNAVNWMLRF